MKPLKVAVVGLNFGGEFPEIYRCHPDVGEVVLCEANGERLKNYSTVFGYTECYQSYDDLLKSDVDAIHITTGIPNHHELTVKALRAGKHCACTVPMATTLEDLCDIIRVQKETGKKYMMMETTIYTFQTLYVKKLLEQGEFGRIQYLRGIHFQDMESWPDYWMGASADALRHPCGFSPSVFEPVHSGNGLLPRLGTDARGTHQTVRQPLSGGNRLRHLP